MTATNPEGAFLRATHDALDGGVPPARMRELVDQVTRDRIALIERNRRAQAEADRDLFA